MNFQSMNFNIKQSITYCLMLCLCGVIFILPEAMADTVTTSDAITNVLCAIVTKLTGPMGKGIATIAIVVLGIGLFVGKLSWPVAIATGIGIGLIFGASQMVFWLGNAGTVGAVNGTAMGSAACGT